MQQNPYAGIGMNHTNILQKYQNEIALINSTLENFNYTNEKGDVVKFGEETKRMLGPIMLIMVLKMETGIYDEFISLIENVTRKSTNLESMTQYYLQAHNMLQTETPGIRNEHDAKQFLLKLSGVEVVEETSEKEKDFDPSQVSSILQEGNFGQV